MKDNIIQIFDGIDKKELKSLHDFVSSPFFNKSRRLSDFYELIYKNFDVYKANGLTKKDLAKKLYPGETYSKNTDENIRKLLSDFGKLLDSYLVTTKFLQDEDSAAITLVKTLRERGMEDKFKKKLADLKKKQEKVKYRDEKYYTLESELIEEELELEFTKNMLRYSETDQRASDNADWNFIMDKLRYFLRTWTKQFYNKENLEYNWTFYDDIEKFIEKNLHQIKKDHAAIFLEYLSVRMFKSEDHEDFKNMKDYLFDNFMRIPKNNYTDYSWNMISFAMLQVNNGNTHFRKDILDLLQELDKQDLLVHSGELLPSDFKIAVDISIAERNLNWTEYFINKYKNKIKKDYSKGLINLSLAKLKFYNENYEDAKKFQDKVEYVDYIHYFEAKLLLAKIEFEKNKFENVISAVETLKKFLKSHKELPEIYLNIYKKFSTDINQLLKLYENDHLGKNIDTDLELFNKSVLNSNQFTHSKEWFLSKIEFIKRSRN